MKYLRAVLFAAAPAALFMACAHTGEPGTGQTTGAGGSSAACPLARWTRTARRAPGAGSSAATPTAPRTARRRRLLVGSELRRCLRLQRRSARAVPAQHQRVRRVAIGRIGRRLDVERELDVEQRRQRDLREPARTRRHGGLRELQDRGQALPGQRLLRRLVVQRRHQYLPGAPAPGSCGGSSSSSSSSSSTSSSSSSGSTGAIGPRAGPSPR